MPEHLSRREKEVLALLVARLTNNEIGERLYISTATVKRHAHNIYQKLNVKNRREVVTKAVALGLITDQQYVAGELTLYVRCEPFALIVQARWHKTMT
mgnify:CR=1 FL=1